MDLSAMRRTARYEGSSTRKSRRANLLGVLELPTLSFYLSGIIDSAHRPWPGAFFCTVLRKRCRTSWQDLRLMERAVRGILLLCVRQKIPGKSPLSVRYKTIRPERGVLTRSIFFSSGAFLRSVFWARCCTRCCRCRCLPVCTVWCCCWQP